MVLNTCEMRSNGVEIAFFSKTFQKIAQRLGASSVIRLSKVVYLHKSTNLDIFICNFRFDRPVGRAVTGSSPEREV